MENRIVLSHGDLLRLRAAVAAQRSMTRNDHEHLRHLTDEMECATIRDAVPADVVAIGSTVTVRDVESAAHDRYTLVLPAQADVAQGRLSVLAPLGTALLGCRAGDTVEWAMPGGLRRLQILSVEREQQPGGTSPAGPHLAAA